MADIRATILICVNHASLLQAPSHSDGLRNGMTSAILVRRTRRHDRERSFAFSRHTSPELCLIVPPSSQEGTGKAGCRPAPAVRCAKGCAKRPHSSIQVWPITRPSLRDGRTAYAVLSREPNSLWPPSPPRKSPAPRRLALMPHPPRLDRSNDGQDHTVLPYARLALRRSFPSPVDGAGNLLAKRT